MDNDKFRAVVFYCGFFHGQIFSFEDERQFREWATLATVYPSSGSVGSVHLQLPGHHPSFKHPNSGLIILFSTRFIHSHSSIMTFHFHISTSSHFHIHCFLTSPPSPLSPRLQGPANWRNGLLLPQTLHDG